MYAFMRYCDDISDSDNPGGDKHALLQQWRSGLDNAMRGEYGNSRILAGFHHAVQSFHIPVSYFHELIDGAEMDLSTNRYETFDELYEYCYRVASVVGLVCIHIFGFHTEAAKDYAESCGVAFQLTNILRDVREDAERNRIYIPLEDLDAFNYSEDDLFNCVKDSRFREMMEFEVNRARDYYDRAKPLVPLVDMTSRAGLAAMIGIYSTLLNRIEEHDYDVFSERIALTTTEKIGIAARSLLWSHPNGRETTLADIQVR
jgi:phytoene synthase